MGGKCFSHLLRACMTRPLIYVDVSLHSNKKRELVVLVCVEWGLCFYGSRTVRQSLEALGCQSKASVGGVALCYFIQWERVALKDCQILSFMCRPICFLATQTLHIITCRQFTAELISTGEVARDYIKEHSKGVFKQNTSKPTRTSHLQSKKKPSYDRCAIVTV